MKKSLLRRLDKVISELYNQKDKVSLYDVYIKDKELLYILLSEYINGNIIDNLILEYYIKNFKYFKKVRQNFLSAYNNIYNKIIKDNKYADEKYIIDTDYNNCIDVNVYIFNVDNIYTKIINLLLSGYTNREIIKILGITKHRYYNIKKRIKNILSSNI